MKKSCLKEAKKFPLPCSQNPIQTGLYLTSQNFQHTLFLASITALHCLRYILALPGPRPSHFPTKIVYGCFTSLRVLHVPSILSSCRNKERVGAGVCWTARTLVIPNGRNTNYKIIFHIFRIGVNRSLPSCRLNLHLTSWLVKDSRLVSFLLAVNSWSIVVISNYICETQISLSCWNTTTLLYVVTQCKHS